MPEKVTKVFRDKQGHNVTITYDPARGEPSKQAIENASRAQNRASSRTHSVGSERSASWSKRSGWSDDVYAPKPIPGVPAVRHPLLISREGLGYVVGRAAGDLEASAADPTASWQPPFKNLYSPKPEHTFKDANGVQQLKQTVDALGRPIASNGRLITPNTLEYSNAVARLQAQKNAEDNEAALQAQLHARSRISQTFSFPEPPSTVDSHGRVSGNRHRHDQVISAPIQMPVTRKIRRTPEGTIQGYENFQRWGQ